MKNEPKRATMKVELKSQSMSFVMKAMLDTQATWTRDKMEGNDLSLNINPDAPMIVQVGDYGYEVQSCGGDGDIDGFVLMCKPEPVCKWDGMSFVDLRDLS